MAKTQLWVRFWTLWPKSGPQRLFSWILPLLDVRNYCKLLLYVISRKTNEPNLRKCKKPSFGYNFGLFQPNFSSQKIFSWVLSLIDLLHRCKLSFYVSSRKTNEPNLRKWKKTLVLGPILACFGPNLVRKIFFRGFYLYQMLEIVASYHCMQFQEKLMNQT